MRQATAAGLSPCSGLIAGMGESDADLVDAAFALRDLNPDSVPVNFLIPFEGTPLAGEWNLTPQRCLRILAMVRFVPRTRRSGWPGAGRSTCAASSRWRCTSPTRSSWVTT